MLPQDGEGTFVPPPFQLKFEFPPPILGGG